MSIEYLKKLAELPPHIQAYLEDMEDHVIDAVLQNPKALLAHISACEEFVRSLGQDPADMQDYIRKGVLQHYINISLR